MTCKLTPGIDAGPADIVHELAATLIVGRVPTGLKDLENDLQMAMFQLDTRILKTTCKLQRFVARRADGSSGDPSVGR